MRVNTQQDTVNSELSAQEAERSEILRVPGIETLHTKGAEELASVLANIIKSRAGLVSVEYVVGKHLKLIYNSNPFNQLRG
jgi:hypothetical protein